MDQILNKEHRDFFSVIAANPERISVAHVQQLKTLVDLYPQSGILRGFLARASQMNEQGNFQQRLKSAAIYAPDRAVLYNLINYPEKLACVREYQNGTSGLIGADIKPEPAVEETPAYDYDQPITSPRYYYDEDAEVETQYFHEPEQTAIIEESYEFYQPQEAVAETPYFEPGFESTETVAGQPEEAPVFSYVPQQEVTLDNEGAQRAEEVLIAQQYEQVAASYTFSETPAVEQPLNYQGEVAFHQQQEPAPEPVNYQQPEYVAPVYEQPIAFQQGEVVPAQNNYVTQEQPVNYYQQEQAAPVDYYQQPENSPQHYNYQQPEVSGTDNSYQEPYYTEEEAPVYYQEAVPYNATNYYQEPEVIQYAEPETTNGYDYAEQPAVQQQDVEYRFHEAEVPLSDVQYFTEPLKRPADGDLIDDEVYDEIIGIDDIYFVPELGTEQIEEVAPPLPQDRIREKYTSYEEVKRDEPAKPAPAFEIENEEPKPKPYSSIIDRAIKKPEVDKDEDDDQRVSKYNDDKLPYSFMWWLDKTRKEHAESHQPYIPAKPVEEEIMPEPEVSPAPVQVVDDQLQQQYYANIFNLSSIEELDKLAVKTVPKEKQTEIIERFIVRDPQIKPGSEKIDNENKAKKSAQDANEIISETLAKIYTDQMLYHKAISTYQKLILKYPEKSSYFVAQIELLEKKIN